MNLKNADDPFFKMTQFRFYKNTILIVALSTIMACTTREPLPPIAPLNEPVKEIAFTRDIIRKGDGHVPPSVLRENYLLRCEAENANVMESRAESYVDILNDRGRITTWFRVSPTRSHYVSIANRRARKELNCVAMHQGYTTVGRGIDEVLMFAAANNLFAELAAQ